ncbi:MAG: hypothetical protein AAFQ38_16370 [Pseudomonadota bacterium]
MGVVKILKRIEAASVPRGTDAILDAGRIVELDDLPRCEAQRSHRYCGTWEAAHPDKTCSLRARYEIDGVKLCARHAGEVALYNMIKEAEAS